MFPPLLPASLYYFERNPHLMKKKRIAAAIGLILIVLFYLATLILAFIDTPLAKNCLMAALFATIVVPAVLYGYMIFTGASHGDSEDQPSAQDDGG